MTAFYSNLHHTREGRSVEDALEFGFISHGWGKAAFDAMKRVREGDVLFARTTNREEVPRVPRGFVGRAVVLADSLPSEEAVLLVDGEWVPFFDLPLGGQYRSTGPYAELVVPVRWDPSVPFEERFEIPGRDGRPIYYRPSTVALDPARPDHAEVLSLLEEAFPAESAESLTPGGFGYGGPPDPAIEEAGMAAVEGFFEDRPGWKTTRVEHQNLGWDIEARGPAGELLNIEVKAKRTAHPTVGISRNELDLGPAREGQWWLAVLTRAMDPDPDPLKWFRADQAKAVAVPMEYRCVLDPAGSVPSPRL